MEHKHREVLLLDGGFGTTLEDVFGKDISNPLWSASLIDSDPEAVVEAHKAFIDAASDIILTSTYQCTFESFHRAGYSDTDAIRLMRKAVSLAARARQHRYNSSRKRAKIALSLGPFGASMTTAQEFTGFYPPPYGPKAFSPSDPESNTNAFGEDGNKAQKEYEAETALKAFHLRRLRVFADDPATWSQIDYVAFETVPLAREIRAIRRAMKELYSNPRVQIKPWWTSTVWPDGKFPQECSPGGERLDAEEVLGAFLDDAADIPVPSGIGVNCTDINYLGGVVERLRVQKEATRPKEKPSLVLYPNGGIPYDTVNHYWVEDSTDRGKTDSAWAERLAKVVQAERSSGAWSSIVVGGCCKTGPKHIQELSRLVL